jgi:UDP-glucose 4-epimerase
VKKIIVLGSSGFVGSAICKLLIAENISVIGIDVVPFSENSLYKFYQSGINQELFSTILPQEEVAVIINAAGKASVKESFEVPYADFNHNTIVTHVILDSIRKYSPKTKFIFLSSAAVYGNPVQLPVKESDPLNPISPYGFHKLQAELIAREFFECFDIKSIVLRIFSCYGAGQKKLLLWDLCNKARLQQDIVLKGCGNESRDFVHVSDVASCVHHLIKRDIKGFEIFNLASGKEHFIKDTAAMLVSKLNNNNTIHFEGKKNTGNPENWVADISKLSETGFVPNVNFEKGIEEYVYWVKNLTF